MPETTQIRVANDWHPRELAPGLPAGGSLDAQPPQRLRLSYLDSFDWRLWHCGARLWIEADGGTSILKLVADDELPVQLALRRLPRNAQQLPEGYLRQRIAPALGLRALIPLGELTLQRQQLAVRDELGNTCARLHVESAQTVGDATTGGSEPLTTVLVEAMPGHDSVFKQLCTTLSRAAVAAPLGTDLLHLAAAAAGRTPGDYSSKPTISLDPRQPTGEAARIILLSLLRSIRMNVQGVIDDLDMEFLHDLRVAVRRSRSLMSQLKSVLPQTLLAPHLDELKWLGSVTGPLRDFDVYLTQMDSYRELLPRRVRDDLGALERVLKKLRRRARGRVVRALRSGRFTALSEGWERALCDDWRQLENDAGASRPVLAVAGERIMAARKRLLRRGRRLGDDPQPEALHRLRIDAKKLRYLLELFRSLYAAEQVDLQVKELKKLQDILGGFNDMAVQQGQTTEFARELLGNPTVRAEELLAMGRLQAVLGSRQEQYGRAFAASFTSFDSAASAAAYAAMCGAEARR